MKLIGLFVFGWMIGSSALSQTAVTRAAQSSKPVPSPAKKTDNKSRNALDSKTEGPITTQIYAEEAFFDSNKNVGVFTGHVKVLDPRFNLQSDKLTVYLHRGEEQGLDKAVAEGNVGVVRDRPNPDGGEPQRAIGRADHAVYTSGDGNVELTGMPKVQQGMNTHVATSSDTVMIINQDGQLTTHGPSRTEIHQEPKDEKGATQPKQ